MNDAAARSATSVMIVDDHALARSGTAGFLEGEGEFRLESTAASVDEALAAMADAPPDLVVVDVNLPGADGFELVRRVAELDHPPRALILSAYDDPQTIRTAMESGAAGYLPKSCTRDEFLAALRIVRDGGLAFSPVALAGASPTPDAPTRRERQVLEQVARGLSNRQIANVLFVSERTVHFHVGNLLAKLGAASRLEAVVKAREAGWIHG